MLLSYPVYVWQQLLLLLPTGELHFHHEFQAWKSQAHILGGENHPLDLISLCAGYTGVLDYFQTADRRSEECQPTCASLPSVFLSATPTSRVPVVGVRQFCWTEIHIHFQTGGVLPSPPSF